jgi:TonB family protein
MLFVGALGTQLLAAAQNVFAQDAGGETIQNGAVLIKLSPPLYPPLAREARIGGDVKIQIEIRPDGSAASVGVISGHPLLKQAALESAQKSQCECRRCGEGLTSYSLTYTFGFRGGGDCNFRRLRAVKCLYLWRCSQWRQRRPTTRPPAISRQDDHITILVDPMSIETIASIAVE